MDADGLPRNDCTIQYYLNLMAVLPSTRARLQWMQVAYGEDYIPNGQVGQHLLLMANSMDTYNQQRVRRIGHGKTQLGEYFTWRCADDKAKADWFRKFSDDELMR